MVKICSATLVSVALVAGFAAAPAVAVTYDAFTSFDGTQGAGNFHYGAAVGAPHDSDEFTNSGPCNIDGTTCLQTAAGDVPGVYKTLGGAFDSVLHPSVSVPADRLILHPGAGDDSAFIVFIAPTAGNYHVTASFSIQDKTPTGVGITEFSYAPNFGTIPLQILTSGGFGYAETIFLQANDVVGFIIDKDGSYFNDSTGVNMTVSTVPEPATWGLMIAGFALTGFAARRRQIGLAA